MKNYINSKLCAIFSEVYCWKHLSRKAQDAYKGKIEAWVAKGHSLESANMFGADLHEIRLQGVNLHDVNLEEANLQKTWFGEANLQDAHLRQANLHQANLLHANLQRANLFRANLQRTELSYANLQGAYLRGAILQEAYLWRANILGAYLEGANLQEAYLWRANLQQAYLRGANLQEADLWRANLQEAHLFKANLQKADFSESKLHGCYMQGVLLDDARYLTWQQVEYTGEEKDKDWMDAQDAYRRLKNYFHQQGQYDDETQAYYREKLMAKHQAHEELFGESKSKGFKRTFQNIGKFFVHNEHKGVRRRWFGLWFMWALSGFGERWTRTICWAAGTFAFFGLVHWLGTNAKWWVLKTHGGEVKHLLDCLYFSLVTFVTLGFGDIWPATWLPKIIVGFEVVFGYVFLGLIVTLIARKMGR